MNVEDFAEWQRRQGHRVIRSESSYWYEAGPRVYQAFPYHWLITPSEQELHHLMVENKIAALRYSTPLEAPEGKISYHIVKDGPYALDLIRSKKGRKHIKEGLSRCRVEEISMARLAEEGWKLQEDTLIRQKRTDSMSKEEWRKMCLSAEGIPGFQGWGGYIGDELASALLTAQVDDVVVYLYAFSLEKYFDMHCNHVVFYSVTTQLQQKEGVKSMFYTLQSLDAPASVDDFKFRIGLDVKPVRQRVVFHPFLKPFANRLSLGMVNSVLKVSSRKNTLAKAQGMLRFYLEGKLPAERQQVHEAVRSVIAADGKIAAEGVPEED